MNIIPSDVEFNFTNYNFNIKEMNNNHEYLDKGTVKMHSGFHNSV